jgi:AcrR family transcriptional regulator
MATKTPEVRPARERLLAAANELFYDEGVHTVGIDRVIERAGVAKATLYSTFGSKEELIRAYLHGRHIARRDRMMADLQRFSSPRERLLGVFDVLGESFADKGYRGCPFLNASAEAPPGSSIIAVTDEYRGWVRSLLTDLARDAGARDPDALARALHLLYDGASVSARMDRDPGAAAAAREVAVVLVDAATTG